MGCAGLKGTGSHDIVVEGAIVPLEWTFVRGGPSSLDTPLYRYPSMALAAQVLAVVGLGVARAALDEIAQIAGGRSSITGAPVLADRAHVQIEVAKAEAAPRSARAFFFETAAQAFSRIEAGERRRARDLPDVTMLGTLLPRRTARAEGRYRRTSTTIERAHCAKPPVDRS